MNNFKEWIKDDEQMDEFFRFGNNIESLKVLAYKRHQGKISKQELAQLQKFEQKNSRNPEWVKFLRTLQK